MHRVFATRRAAVQVKLVPDNSQYKYKWLHLSLDMRIPTAVARFRSRTASFCLATDAGFLADLCMAWNSVSICTALNLLNLHGFKQCRNLHVVSEPQQPHHHEMSL